MTHATVWEDVVGFDAEVARLRRGDLDGLRVIVERYQHRLYRYLLRLLRDPAAADDLFQQTWLRVAERIRQFDPRRSFEPWLFTVARNLALDHLRRYRPESLDEPAAGGDARGDFLSADAPGALERVIELERAAGVARAMSELPAIYREVLTLRFEEEMKLEEIAEVLDAPLSTVKTRLRRALEAMRHTLESRAAEGRP